MRFYVFTVLLFSILTTSLLLILIAAYPQPMLKFILRQIVRSAVGT